MTSSGSDASVKAVNPRRSQNSTVTSRPWLAKRESGASEEAITCATCEAEIAETAYPLDCRDLLRDPLLK